MDKKLTLREKMQFAMKELNYSESVTNESIRLAEKKHERIDFDSVNYAYAIQLAALLVVKKIAEKLKTK